MKFVIKVNQELEGWDIVEVNGIQSDEGFEDSVVATFYEQERAILYCKILNG
jgi:hypothetical protein